MTFTLPFNEQQFEAINLRERMNRVLEGEFYYARVHSPNPNNKGKFKKDPAFEVYVRLLTPEMEERARSYGLKIKEPTEQIPGPHVMLKRKYVPNRKGQLPKVDVVDSMQKPIPGSILIGNTSTGLVKFQTFWYPRATEFGIGVGLSKVQVKKLVPYETSKDSSLDYDEEGFTVPTEQFETQFDDDDGFVDPAQAATN